MYKKFLISVFLFLLGSLAAHDLQKVVLIENTSQKATPRQSNSGFEAIGLDVPGGLADLNATLGPRFVGQPINEETLLELKRSIILYYSDRNYPVVSVEIPEQKVSDHTVVVIVNEGKMGKLRVQGNKYSDESFYRKQISLKKGQPINSDVLMNDIAWINRNPFTHAEVVFTPGEKPLETDVEIVVKDRLPFRPYVGVDNTGVNVTDEIRIWAGFNARGFLSNHVITYQFTMAPEYRKFWAHTLHYLAPLPCHHNLIVFGGYSHVHPHITDFHSSGHSAQGSLRYDIPFRPLYKPFYQTLSFGFDFKNIHNNLNFFSEEQVGSFSLTAQQPVVTKVVNVTQLYAGYKLHQVWDDNSVAWRIEAFYSPGGWLPNQADSNFSNYHPGAINRYIYGLTALQTAWTLLHGCSFRGTLRGQIASAALIPSEQFGLGGYDTVRGYDEREVNYDDAVCVNCEFHFPSFRVLRMLKSNPDKLTFLAFVDYATGRNVTGGEGETNWQQLLGVGPGMRYQIADYLSARLDWGFRLHKIEFTNLGGKLHFGVMASY